MEVVVLWSAGSCGHANCSALARVGGAGSRIRRRVLTARDWAGDAPESGRKPHAVPAATVERLVELALSPPSAGRRRWITRLLAQKSALTPGCVRRAAPQRAQAAVRTALARGGTTLTMPVDAGSQPSHASTPLAVVPRVRPLHAARGPCGSAAGATDDAVLDHGAGHRPRPHGSLARRRLRRVAGKGKGRECPDQPRLGHHAGRWQAERRTALRRPAAGSEGSV